MGLFKKNQPQLKQIEVSNKNVKLRLVFAIVFLVLGVALIGYWIYGLVTKEPGWYTIEITQGHTELNDELIFNYCIGDNDELSAADEHKLITTVYSTEAGKAAELFDVYKSYDDVVNLYTINQKPGEALKVENALYEAFELMEKYESRILYMAPIFSDYRNLCASQTEQDAKLCDPHTDEETRLYFEQVMKYASDPEMIRVELLDDNKVSLYIAEEYREFLDKHEIKDYIDFGWLTNAFVVDYVADVMISRGYTSGNITSYDGYTRNFDESDERYAFNVFDRIKENVYPAAVAQYKGPISMVFLRNYPMSTLDMSVYFAYSDGNYAHRYADTINGVYKSALNNLVSYSYNVGCAEVALMMADTFIADELDLANIDAMADKQVYSVWCIDKTIYCNDGKITLSDLYSKDDVSYKSEFHSNEK